MLRNPFATSSKSLFLSSSAMDMRSAQEDTWSRTKCVTEFPDRRYARLTACDQ